MGTEDSGARLSLVALKSERERTTRVLSRAYADDLLDVDEFEDRMEKAMEAKTCEALVYLRADVEMVRANQVEETGLTEIDREAQAALTREQPETKWAVAVMSGYESKGRWRVPKTLRVSAVMGGCELDFREALIAPGITDVKIMAVMGGVEILVPPDINVECEGIGILGAFESDTEGPAVNSNRPTLRISGLACFGGVSIETRLPRESGRDARKRRKREGKALKAERKTKWLGE